MVGQTHVVRQALGLPEKDFEDFADDTSEYSMILGFNELLFFGFVLEVAQYCTEFIVSYYETHHFETH